MRLWPFGPRAQITRTPGALIISIPAPRNIIILLFMSVWLVAWTAAEVFVPWQLVTGEIEFGTFMLGWLIGWTAAGAFAIYSWLWIVRGREVVRVTRRMLGIRRRVWRFGAERQFDAAHISGLRLVADAWHPFREEESSSYNWSEGPIAFEYGDRTVRFGKGLRKKEAHDIVNEIAAVWR